MLHRNQLDMFIKKVSNARDQDCVTNLQEHLMHNFMLGT